MSTRLSLSLLLGLGVFACGGEETSETPETPSETVTPDSVEPTPEEEEVHEDEAALNADDVCASAIVVAWQGAAHASEEITRTQEEARARAEELLARVEHGEDFATLAREHSDASSSGPRGGLLGTYTRDEWPGAHQVLLDPVVAAPIGGRTQVIEASYGYVFAQRCAIQKVHTRHILVRFAGARNAGDDVERTEEAAQMLATEIQALAAAEGADFAALATERSEDASAENGGDLGEVGRGRLAPEYEAVAFELEVGQVSDVVQSDFGFHIIQRVE